MPCSILQVEGAVNQQNRPPMQTQTPRGMLSPSYPSSQPNRETYPSAMQYPDSAPPNSSDQYRPNEASYSRPSAMPDYTQTSRQQAPPQQAASSQPAAPRYNFQPPADTDSPRGYGPPLEYDKGGPDAGRGYPGNSRAYDGARPAAVAGRQDYANSNAQPLSPQSPSAAEAKKAAYRYCPCLLSCTCKTLHNMCSLCLAMLASLIDQCHAEHARLCLFVRVS